MLTIMCWKSQQVITCRQSTASPTSMAHWTNFGSSSTTIQCFHQCLPQVLLLQMQVYPKPHQCHTTWAMCAPPHGECVQAEAHTHTDCQQVCNLPRPSLCGSRRRRHWNSLGLLLLPWVLPTMAGVLKPLQADAFTSAISFLLAIAEETQQWQSDWWGGRWLSESTAYASCSTIT